MEAMEEEREGDEEEKSKLVLHNNMILYNSFHSFLYVNSTNGNISSRMS
jgi:hypothetical protein